MLNNCETLDFLKTMVGGGIIIYGTGDDGGVAKNIIRKDYSGKIIYCDSFKTGEFMGEKIISPKDILSYPNYPILIASRKYEYEIYFNLLEMSVDPKVIFSLKTLLDKAEHPGKMYINNFEIEVDSENFCYVNKLHLYDKFLPILASVIKDGFIIDIGANVGDTVSGMLPFTDAKFLCIEPQDKFYSLLLKNLETFPSELKNRVITSKCLISDDTHSAYTLSSGAGTAHMMQGTNELLEAYTAKRLGDVLAENNINLSDVRLIKSDTDGNDFHCLMSLGEKIKSISPILYFENELDDERTSEGFRLLGKYLCANGYDDFWFFDNYGNYLGHGNYDVYRSINHYLSRMLIYNTPRTFWYVDVLTAKIDKIELCKEAIMRYEDKFPCKKELKG